MPLKILVIDDEPLIRRSLARAFQSQGHEVLTAEDGTKGIQLWKEQNPDTVFVDVLMPGLKGPDVIRAMQGHHSSRVILMTAYSGGENLSTDGLSIQLFLKKPFEDIFKLVKQVEDLKA